MSKGLILINVTSKHKFVKYTIRTIQFSKSDFKKCELLSTIKLKICCVDLIEVFFDISNDILLTVIFKIKQLKVIVQPIEDSFF